MLRHDNSCFPIDGKVPSSKSDVTHALEAKVQGLMFTEVAYMIPYARASVLPHQDSLQLALRLKKLWSYSWSFLGRKEPVHPERQDGRLP